jgi:hypothetical protein
MRATSQLYKTLRAASGSFYELRITCGQNTYGNTRLKSAKIYPALFDGSGPKIGQAYTAECDLTLRENSANWPRGAEFTVDLRICSADETEHSEWLTMGTFNTDQRSKTENGDLAIVAFDDMHKLETSWSDKIPDADLPAVWPITSQAMGALLVEATGIELDSRTVLDDTVACWGLDTTSTARERWQDIAAAHGGNLIITPERKLRLVPFVDSGIEEECAIAGIALVGVAVVGTGDLSELSADYIPVGMNCKKLKSSPPLDPISAVCLETEAGTMAEAGTDSGYKLSGVCNFSDSHGLAALCLSKVTGYVYRPFEAEKAVLDPAAEPGDLIGIPGGICQVMCLKWNLGMHPRADISAPFDAEIDHEYTVDSAAAKSLKKALSATADLERRTYSAIEQTETSIMQRVGEEYATKDGVNQVTERIESAIIQTKDEITVELNRVEAVGDDRYEEQQSYLRYKDGILTLGKSGSASTLRQSNEGQGLFMNEDETFHVDQNEMVSPNKFRVPLGGSVQMGDFIFQPRTSGNMSLLWVGE